MRIRRAKSKTTPTPGVVIARALERAPVSKVAERTARARMQPLLFGAGRFRTTMMDPPWAERGSGKIKRGADRHYPVMSTDDIIRTIKGCPIFDPTEDAHLYCWVTNSFLPDGLRVVEALGFRYVTNIAWTKTHAGIGRYFRGKHELLLFGVRGRGFAEDLITDAHDIPSALVLDHVRRDGERVHSKKPVEFYELIERRSRGPYAEIFARNERPEWESWGNEL